MSDQSTSPATPTHASLKLYTPAVDFIENRLPDYHDAFDVRHIRYDPSRSQFVAKMPQSRNLVVPGASYSPQPREAPAPTSEMRFWTDIFPVAMGRLRNEPTIGGESAPGCDIRHLSKWPDVQSRLEKARKLYDFESGSGRGGKVRRGARRFLDNYHATAQQLLKAAPSVEIASPIVNIVSLIIDAYAHAAEVRQEVGSSLEGLSVSFANVEHYLLLYPKDTNIIESSVHLVLATLKAIEHTIKFYTSTQVKRAGKAIFNGPQYQEILMESLAEIKTCCDALESQAKMSFEHRMIGDNRRIVEGNEWISQENAITHKGLEAIFNHQTAGGHWMQSMFNRVLSLMSDMGQNWPYLSPIPSRSVTPQPMEPPPWTPRDLLQRLFIPNLEEVDLKYVMSHAEEMLHEDRGQAQQVIETHQFRNWIASPTSSKLLVHGDFSDGRDISPFSILSAVLTLKFREPGRFIGLVFFCGRHLVHDDYWGGIAMIRSLIAQLLRQFPYQNIRPEPRISHESIERGGPDVLCNLFLHLVRQIPSKTSVICIIDGINLYESEHYFSEMERVILCLNDLVHDTSWGIGSPFKLLLTSSLATLEVRKIFDLDPQTLLHVEEMPYVGRTSGLGHFQGGLTSFS